MLDPGTILSGVILTDSYNFSSFSLFLVTRSYSVGAIHEVSSRPLGFVPTYKQKMDDFGCISFWEDNTESSIVKFCLSSSLISEHHD